MKPGDKIVWFDDLDSLYCREGVLEGISTSSGWEYVKIAGQKHEVPLFYCWPIELKQEVLNLIQQRIALKKAYDDSVVPFYKLRNRLARAQQEHDTQGS